MFSEKKSLNSISVNESQTFQISSRMNLECIKIPRFLLASFGCCSAFPGAGPQRIDALARHPLAGRKFHPKPPNPADWPSSYQINMQLDSSLAATLPLRLEPSRIATPTASFSMIRTFIPQSNRLHTNDKMLS